MKSTKYNIHTYSLHITMYILNEYKIYIYIVLYIHTAVLASSNTQKAFAKAKIRVFMCVCVCVAKFCSRKRRERPRRKIQVTPAAKAPLTKEVSGWRPRDSETLLTAPPQH